MKYTITAEDEIRVIDLLSEKISGISLNALKRLLKNREIKINGKRICENAFLTRGDIIEIFVPQSFVRSEVNVIYEDDNILIVDKPPYSIVTGGLTELLKSRYQYIAPVHRLDRNTCGLVVFAKNEAAEKALLTAFKERRLEKKYRALVKGIPKNGQHRAYLYNDDKKCFSYVSDILKSGYKEIITVCEVIKSYGDGKANSISDVELILVTGRTHQIRAHLKHLNCPIIGDDKYGDYQINKLLGISIQQLVAVSIEFYDIDMPLDYLNGKKIALNFSFDKELLQKAAGKLHF